MGNDNTQNENTMLETENVENENQVSNVTESVNEEKSKNWTCSKCGAVLDADHEFCSKCGTPKILKCAFCGAVLSAGQEFCPKCGKKVASDKSKIISAIKDINVKKKTNKKIVPVIGVIAAVVVIIVLAIALKKPPVDKVLFDEEALEFIEGEEGVASYTFEPSNAKAKELVLESSDENVATISKDGTITAIGSGTCNITVYADKKKDTLKITVKSLIESYLEDGNYEKAYDAAENDEERLSVMAENLAAVESAFSASNLKDPSSFVLREAYYDDDKNYLVLVINGNNSYGASVTNYWLYNWDSDDQEWEYFTSVSDLSEEEYKSYDDYEDKLEKLVDNIGRGYIKDTMSKGYELNKAAIARINKMFEDDILDTVKLLDLNFDVI